MWRYLFNKIFYSIIVFVLSLTLIFVFFESTSELFIANQLGMSSSPEKILEVKTMYQLNLPIEMRLLNWVQRVSDGKLFRSYLYDGDVLPVLLSRLGITSILLGVSLLFSLLLTTLLSMWATAKQNKWQDRWIRIFGIIGISIPEVTYFVVLYIIFRHSYTGLSFFNQLQFQDQLKLGDYFNMMLFPTIFLTVKLFGTSLRYVRAEMIDISHQDYVMAAKSRGYSPFKIYFNEIFKNALVSVVSVIDVLILEAINSLVILEILFKIPGFFASFVSTVVQRDTYLVISHFIVAIMLILVINLIVDICLALVDPRIKYV